MTLQERNLTGRSLIVDGSRTYYSSQSSTQSIIDFRDFIPPEKTIPLGFHVRSAILVVHGRSSAKTPRLRRRRRIKWLVWDFSERSQYFPFVKVYESRGRIEALASEVGRGSSTAGVYVRRSRALG